MTYWRLHYHLIWATAERQPTLTAGREKVFYGVLYKKAEELELKIHAAGNVADHRWRSRGGWWGCYKPHRNQY